MTVADLNNIICCSSLDSSPVSVSVQITAEYRVR